MGKWSHMGNNFRFWYHMHFSLVSHGYHMQYALVSHVFPSLVSYNVPHYYCMGFAWINHVPSNANTTLYPPYFGVLASRFLAIFSIHRELEPFCLSVGRVGAKSVGNTACMSQGLIKHNISNMILQ